MTSEVRAADAADGGDPHAGVIAVLAASFLLATTMGSPVEEVLQDTLKSSILAIGVLLSLCVFFWTRRQTPVRIPPALVLPGLLFVHAVCSVGWAHPYLACAEAARWLLVAALVLIASNCLNRKTLPRIAWCIVLGATAASLYAAAQFWFDVRWFSQGPQPASTFLNRNFFAEFAQTTPPLIGALLVTERRGSLGAALVGALTVILLALCMTGARAALLSFGIQAVALALFFSSMQRRGLISWRWSIRATTTCAAAALLGFTLLGSIPSSNAAILKEGKGATALERATSRMSSVGHGDSSLNMRGQLWTATARMIAAHPLSGVGAGSWENVVPLYQPGDSLIELDYYAHNEFLQVVAEYGVCGMLFVLGLVWCIAQALRVSRTSEDRSRALWAAALGVMLVGLLIVSAAGFPWHMAVTSWMLALGLGGIDAVTREPHAFEPRATSSSRWLTPLGAIVSTAALAGGIYVANWALQSEYRIIHATRIAMSIAESPNPNAERWDGAKRALLEDLQVAVATNPQFRKVTPAAAEAVASWGDWRNARWIWESVIASRPHVVSILVNLARANHELGDEAAAVEYMRRADAVWRSPDRAE